MGNGGMWEKVDAGAAKFRGKAARAGLGAQCGGWDLQGSAFEGVTRKGGVSLRLGSNTHANDGESIN